MNQPILIVTANHTTRLRDELRAKDHNAIADHLWLKHPNTLGVENAVPTGGGCEAYMIDIPWNDQNLLVVWTTSDGADLAEADDYMIGVYLGEEITEDPLALIESDES
jgi:hypothetical protein